MSEEKLHRTVVYVESIEWGSNGATVRCTPAGVDLPAGCASVNMRSFPESMRDTIEHGKCFFAKVNLGANQPSRVRIEDIEEGWGKTDGLLHFEEEPRKCRACGAAFSNRHERGCVYSHPGHDRVDNVQTQIDPITEASLGQPPFCPDGGTCHHECQGRDCFRVRCCGPLSDVYKDDEWPEALRCYFN